MKKMKTLLLTLALSCTFAAAMVAVGCGDDGGNTPSSSSNASTSTDSSVDSSTDASVDSSVDESTDASVDSSVDESTDASEDSSVDESTDVSEDSSVDESTDASEDSSVDESTDVSEDSSEDWFDDEENPIKIRFATSYTEVRQYETVDLDCMVKGTTAAVEFTSSDESIATVDANGVITTYGKLGTVTITATVEGESATCEVRVTETSYAPVIVLNSTEYTIETGETLEFTVSSEWNNTELSEDVEYKVSFAEDTQDVASAISVDGNVVKVVAGDSAESFDVIVSATIRGIYTNASFKVNVINGGLKLQAKSADFTPSDGQYVTNIYATGEFGDLNSVLLDFVVTKAGQEVATDISWTVTSSVLDYAVATGEDKNAVAVEDGNIVGKKRGYSILTGTAEFEGETATVEVLCNVAAVEIHLEDEIAPIEIANLKTFNTTSVLSGNLKTAEIHGREVHDRIAKTADGRARIQFSSTNFPSTAKELGAQQLVLNTDLVRYTLDVEIYTMVINDAAELDAMREMADTHEEELNYRYNVIKPSQYFDGYFVLGNDIDYNKEIMSMTDTGSVWWCQGTTEDHTRGFRGVFDGQGYNIDGVTVGAKHPSGSNKESGGIFGYLSKEGIVKNVSFTNAVLCANNGFICSMGDGTIENVSISYKKIGGDKATESVNPTNNIADIRTMGSFFSYKAGSNATVRNCLVDASAADITEETGWFGGTKTYNINLIGKAKNVNNVIAICPNQKVLDTSGADVQKLNYVEMSKEIELLDKFDSTIWTSVENIPMFVKQAENLDVDAEVGFLNVKDSLVAGFEMLILPSNPYVKIELAELQGVTYENNLLQATEEAFGKTAVLTVTSLLNPDITATHEVYIDSYGEEVAVPGSGVVTVTHQNSVISIDDNAWMGDTNYVYIGSDIISVDDGAESVVVDIEKLTWGEQPVTLVMVKEGVRTHFDLTLNKWFEVDDFANSEVVTNHAFHESRRENGGIKLVEVENIPETIKAAEGYENVTRMDSYTQWISALGREFFNDQDISGYTDLWFGVAITNGRFISQAIEVPTTWAYFHFVQVVDGEWVAEVTIDGKLYKTEFNIQGTKVQDLLYRGGWSTGFLWYNNQQAEDQVTESQPTSIYSTEIRGVKKVVEDTETEV